VGMEGWKARKGEKTGAGKGGWGRGDTGWYEELSLPLSDFWVRFCVYMYCLILT